MRESGSVWAAWRHLKSRHEWASQDWLCGVIRAKTIAWEAWQGWMWCVWEAMGPLAKMWSMGLERGGSVTGGEVGGGGRGDEAVLR